MALTLSENFEDRDTIVFLESHTHGGKSSMSAPHTPPWPPPGSTYVDPKELRPRRRWYTIGVVSLIALVVSGAIGFFTTLLPVLGQPEFDAEVHGTGEADFALADPEEGLHQLSLYVSPSGGVPQACVLRTPEGEREFSSSNATHEGHTNSASWEMVGRIRGLEAGEYTLSCEGNEETTYSVTQQDILDDLLFAFFGALGFAIVLPGLGVLIGATILIVTAVRRNSHKRRLLAERARYGATMYP